jgi:hypothetical protein
LSWALAAIKLTVTFFFFSLLWIKCSVAH